MGKSTLINSILGVERAQTSKTPGKTKALTFYQVLKEECRLVDCPGYGFARASQQEKERWRKFMMAYLMKSTSLQRVMLLIDLNVGLQPSDELLMDMLTDSHKQYTLVLTKVDKIKKEADIRTKTDAVVNTVISKGHLLCSPVVHLVSSYTGFGMKELRSDCIYILEQTSLQAQLA